MSLWTHGTLSGKVLFKWHWVWHALFLCLCEVIRATPNCDKHRSNHQQPRGTKKRSSNKTNEPSRCWSAALIIVINLFHTTEVREKFPVSGASWTDQLLLFISFLSFMASLPLLCPPFPLTGIVRQPLTHNYSHRCFMWVFSSSKQTFNPIQIAGTQVSQQLFPQCESKPLSGKHKSCKTNVWRRASGEWVGGTGVGTEGGASWDYRQSRSKQCLQIKTYWRVLLTIVLFLAGSHNKAPSCICALLHAPSLPVDAQTCGRPRTDERRATPHAMDLWPRRWSLTRRDGGEVESERSTRKLSVSMFEWQGLTIRNNPMMHCWPNNSWPNQWINYKFLKI